MGSSSRVAMRSFLALACLAVAICAATSEVAMLQDGNEYCGIKNDGCMQNFYKHTQKCICHLCSECKDGQWLEKPCGGTSDSTCTTCGKCNKQQYTTKKCTASANTECATCSTCPDGQTTQTKCTEDADTACKVCSTCANGAFQTQACSAQQDTVCEDCAPCNDGEYAKTPCGPKSNTECASCTVCDPSVTGFAKTKCSKTQNTVCQMCGTCDEKTHYVKTECTAESDIVCSPHAYAVQGKTKTLNDDNLRKMTQEDKAHVRCVSDTHAISICNSGKSNEGGKCKDALGPNDECSKSFIPAEGGKNCSGACKDADKRVEVTFSVAQDMCAQLDMRLPKKSS